MKPIKRTLVFWAAILQALAVCAAQSSVPDSKTLTLDGWQPGWMPIIRVSETDHPGLPVIDGNRPLDQAALWEVAQHPSLDSTHFLADWTGFDELRFWAWLKEPVDFDMPIVFVSEGGYYITDWKLDWQGWKEHRIRLADCRKAHRPAGWERIGSFGFRPQGYGQGPVPEGLTLLLAGFALHSPKALPVHNIADWVALARVERMKELKARGNPYYLAVLDSLKNVEPEPSLPQPDELTSPWQFSGFASKALTEAWAAAWEESPRKGDPILIRNASAIVDYCLDQQKDGSWFYSRPWGTGDPNSDRFALGPLMDAVYWLRKLPEGEQCWTRWNAPLKQLVDFQYQHWGLKGKHAWGDSAREYPNQDVFHLYEMALADRWWPDPRYRENVDVTLKGLEDHLLADGGLNYIGPETEIPCYHDLNVLWIARYLALTESERARTLLARTVNYYPLVCSNEGRPEYYTDCWWKHYWSDGAACGPEIIAGLLGDAHNKWLADRLLERLGTGEDYHAVYAGMFYRKDVKAEPLPDNYVKLDANIRGPRGRFGSWYFAGTPGGGARDTFVGAMVCLPERAQPLAGAMLAANVEAGSIGPAGERRRELYLSGPDDITANALATDCGAVAARYTLRKAYINSRNNPQVPPTAWQATQVWLLTRYGLVGLVELEATERETIGYLGGELRFGPDFPIVQDDTGDYHCGALSARLLESNFPIVESGPARPGYAQKSTAHQAVNLWTAGTSVDAGPGSPLRYAVWIAPEGAPALADYRRIESPGLWGFQARLDDKPVAIVFNPGKAEASLQWTTGKVNVPQAAVLILNSD